MDRFLTVIGSPRKGKVVKRRGSGEENPESEKDSDDHDEFAQADEKKEDEDMDDSPDQTSFAHKSDDEKSGGEDPRDASKNEEEKEVEML